MTLSAFARRASTLISFLSLALLLGAPMRVRPIGPTRPLAPAAAAALVASPYIGETTPASVVVAWATDAPGTSNVRYSADTSYAHSAPATTVFRDGKYWHAALITGLTADTTYHYRIDTGGADLTPWSDVTFRTAPPADATQVVFAGLGDSRPGSTSAAPSASALQVAAQLAQRSFAFALHTGDIVYGGGVCSGGDSGWNQYLRGYFDVYEDSLKGTPFYTAIGNHELGSGSCGYQAYTDVFHLPDNGSAGDEERYYAFDWGNVHVIVLNTEQSYAPGSAQYAWLENDLQNADRRWIVAVFHRPAYSSGPHGSTANVQTYLVPLFEQYGVDVVLNGHDHTYERTCPIKHNACTTVDDGGVVYIVTGGAGASAYTPAADWFTARASSKHHFLSLTVDDCTMQIEAIDDQGNAFDAFEIDKCLADFAPAQSIAITGGDVQLAWRHVTQDSAGKALDIEKYHVYRATAPYQGENATRVDTVRGPFSSVVTWIDADHIGNASVNYFYTIRSVVMDGAREILSQPSRNTGEFDFALTPGTGS